MEIDQCFDIGGLRYEILSQSHAQDLYRVLSDVRVSEWVYWLPTPFLREDADALIRKAQEGIAAKTEFLFAVRCIGDGRYVGNVNIHKKTGHEAEIGYWLDKTEHGQGLATKMTAFAVWFSAQLPEIESLCATTAIDNIASQRLLEKNGFVFEKQIVSTGGASGQRKSNLYRKMLR